MERREKCDVRPLRAGKVMKVLTYMKLPVPLHAGERAEGMARVRRRGSEMEEDESTRHIKEGCDGMRRRVAGWRKREVS